MTKPKKIFEDNTCNCDDENLGYSLVSLFNGISTFLGYLIPNPSFLKNINGTI